ncbi:hypoxia induced protein conserved region-domain-containing protein [Irpex rosettiformis]|uniref:Hypoxia induced protein conserved region-domain-containing protein n=1 Tax=Irpex rosettiformis TaxID=378272 RepID=A0ACB8U582_9APHY|nr:hypoxia induced protein conserved region-domain-containing protein [Irpex rosettiformis]
MSVYHVQPDGVESWKEKFIRRFKEEPLVPIGTALTCFALIMASRKVGKKGESASLNRWFRARIVFQGATIAAIVAGSYAVKKQREGSPVESLSAEEQKMKEREEFEVRLRKAEETHAQEQAFRGGKPKEKEKGIFAKLGLGRGPAGSVMEEESLPPPVTSVSAVPAPPTPAETPTAEPTQESGKSWLSWGGKNST